MIQYRLITGSSRGIGYEFLRQYAKDTTKKSFIFAGCRDPQTLQKKLETDGMKMDNIKCIELDVANEESINSLPERLLDHTQKPIPYLSLLIHNAGIATENHPNDLSSTTTAQSVLRVFTTNTLGPMRVTQVLFPLLHAGVKQLIESGEVTKDAPTKTTNAIKVATVSSDLGSIAHNIGDKTAYRISKTAVNQLMRTFSKDEKDIVFLLLSPGWVATDMGTKGNRSPPLKPAESVSGMKSVIDHADGNSTGCFIHYDGSTIPW
jgi:NAD(P)-dependent dehydrogenase (short-subunit alcohol dehydrogenase family)